MQKIGGRVTLGGHVEPALAWINYRSNVCFMPFAQSKVTAQGQISVLVEVRNKLGVGPSSTLEWTEDGDKVVVTRGGRYDWEDVRAALFGGKPPKPRSLAELKEGVRQHMRHKHALD